MLLHFVPKIGTPTYIHNFVNSQQIFTILSLAHTGKFPIKLLLNIPPHPKRVATLPCEIWISKIARTEAQQRQTKRAWTKENVIVVDELVLSQWDQPQTQHLAHYVAQAGAIHIIFARWS